MFTTVCAVRLSQNRFRGYGSCNNFELIKVIVVKEMMINYIFQVPFGNMRNSQEMLYIPLHFRFVSTLLQCLHFLR